MMTERNMNIEEDSPSTLEDDLRTANISAFRLQRMAERRSREVERIIIREAFRTGNVVYGSKE